MPGLGIDLRLKLPPELVSQLQGLLKAAWWHGCLVGGITVALCLLTLYLVTHRETGYRTAGWGAFVALLLWLAGTVWREQPAVPAPAPTPPAKATERDRPRRPWRTEVP